MIYYITSYLSYIGYLLTLLLNIYQTFPIPKDVNITYLRNSQFTSNNFEKILFQQLLNYYNILFKITNLNKDYIMDAFWKRE